MDGDATYFISIPGSRVESMNMAENPDYYNIVYSLSIKEVNKLVEEVQNDSERKVASISFKHWKEKAPQCKPTIDGYKKWKK